MKLICCNETVGRSGKCRHCGTVYRVEARKPEPKPSHKKVAVPEIKPLADLFRDAKWIFYILLALWLWSYFNK